jgi:sortase A
VEGDTFTITVLNQTLTYEVDQIRTVEPTDLSDLQIEKGKDYLTLVTCTPYGQNTHRLLVRGHRIETVPSAMMRFSADALQIDPLIVMPFLAAPILLLLFLAVMLRPTKKKVRPTLEQLSGK